MTYTNEDARFDAEAQGRCPICGRTPTTGCPHCPICGKVDCDGACEEYDDDYGPDESMDGDHASALESIGWGDEDYGCYDGGDDW
jgi:hypothetical protein